MLETLAHTYTTLVIVHILLVTDLWVCICTCIFIHRCINSFCICSHISEYKDIDVSRDWFLYQDMHTDKLDFNKEKK